MIICIIFIFAFLLLFPFFVMFFFFSSFSSIPQLPHYVRQNYHRPPWDFQCFQLILSSVYVILDNSFFCIDNIGDFSFCSWRSLVEQLFAAYSINKFSSLFVGLCPYTGEYGSMKTHILAYFMQ